MRIVVCLIATVLTGCQGLTVFDRDEERSPAVMQLWERYQQCLASTDPDWLLPLVDQFEQAMPTGSEPPAWMKILGQQVKRQPLRTSVDPSALGAACTIKTAMVLAQHTRLSEARTLYRRILTRYNERDWAYYQEQAKDSLATLPQNDPTVVALRYVIAPFQAQ